MKKSGSHKNLEDQVWILSWADQAKMNLVLLLDYQESVHSPRLQADLGENRAWGVLMTAMVAEN